MNVNCLKKILVIDPLPTSAIPVYQGLAEEVVSPKLVPRDDKQIELAPIPFWRVMEFISTQFKKAKIGKHECLLPEQMVSLLDLDPTYNYYHARNEHCGLVCLFNDEDLFGVFITKNSLAKKPRKRK